MNNKISDNIMNQTVRQRTEITIETHSIMIIRTNSRRHSAHCERCGETVSAFTPEQTAMFLRLDLTEICRRIESGKLHLTQNRRAIALVCGNSENKEIRFNR